jgi:DNA-binding transcriptional MerR regulator
VHPCNSSDSLAQDVFWFTPDDDAGATQTEFTITELAEEFGLTHRALRFYEVRGLLAPQRKGRRRIFSRADRDRLALIVKAKRLGFTLAEIGRMVEAQSGEASEARLKLSAEKCLEQIAHFERQMREAGEALAELRRIHLSLCLETAQRKP